MDRDSLCRLEIMVADALSAGSSNTGEEDSQICHFEFSFMDQDNQRNEVLIVGSCRGVCMQLHTHDMYVCVCIYIYAYIFIYSHLWTRIIREMRFWLWAGVCVCMYLCVCVCMSLCVYVFMYVCVYVCMYVCLYEHAFVRACVCIY